MHSPKKNGPSYFPDGPVLELEVLGDRKNFIDLQRTRLEIVPGIVRNDATMLRLHATEAANRDTLYSLSSLYLSVHYLLLTLILSTTNVNFAQKSLIETKFPYGSDAQKLWLAFQGYYYEEKPSAFDGNGRRAEDVTER